MAVGQRTMRRGGGVAARGFRQGLSEAADLAAELVRRRVAVIAATDGEPSPLAANRPRPARARRFRRPSIRIQRRLLRRAIDTQA